MRKCDVREAGEALAYITDCNLATVSSMAMTKSRRKGEYLRQQQIAQIAIDWMKEMGISMKGTRAQDIVDGCGGRVDAWVKHYEQ